VNETNKFPLRWVVVEIRSTYDGKNTDAAIYPCADEAAADELCNRIEDHNLHVAYIMGGYPDLAWVLDLSNPESLENANERRAELDEYDEETAEVEER
jgi:hypothetical protein